MFPTLDRESVIPLVATQIGRTQALTPAGYLLCTDVRIAGTSPMLYAPQELPNLDPGGERMLVVQRAPEALFSPECIASFSGMPITLDHPSAMVSSKSWKKDAVGVVLNPRRGEGPDNGFLLADLLITDAKTIDEVRAGLREVSCGYDCEYEQIRPGMGRQIRILGNHVAILERGRCGPSCSIGDAEMTRISIRDRLRAAFTLGDKTAFDRLVDEAPDEPDNGGGGGPPHPVVVHVHNQGQGGGPENDEPTDPLGKLTKAVGVIGDGMAKINDQLVEHGKKFAAYDERFAKMDQAAEGGGDPDKKDEPDKDDTETKDSAALVVDYRAALAKAEILAPGGKSIPMFDAKAPSKDTLKALCDFRRETLKRAIGDARRAPLVDRAFGGRRVDLAKVPCGEIALAFDAAVEFARLENNEAAKPRFDVAAAKSGPMTTSRFQEIIEARRKQM